MPDLRELLNTAKSNTPTLSDEQLTRLYYSEFEHPQKPWLVRMLGPLVGGYNFTPNASPIPMHPEGLSLEGFSENFRSYLRDAFSREVPVEPAVSLSTPATPVLGLNEGERPVAERKRKEKRIQKSASLIRKALSQEP
jgi:hypothetical protein